MALQNNELQEKLIKQKEHYEKKVSDLKKKNKEKESRLANVKFLYKVSLKRLKELNSKKVVKNNKSLNLLSKPMIKKSGIIIIKNSILMNIKNSLFNF